ncbi:MAG: tetratricopeptide repeat protein [Planctomycetota bacterium]
MKKTKLSMRNIFGFQLILRRAYYELARIYAATERDELALSQLKIAVELAPDSVEIHYAVAKVYEKLGDYVLSAQHVEKYSKLREEQKENRSDQKK